MNVLISFQLQVVFGDLEACNMNNLAIVEEWLKYHFFGYDVFKNEHLPKKIRIREISIYCPKNTDSILIQELNDLLQTLLDPSSEPEPIEEKPNPFEEVEITHKEVKAADNQKELAAYLKSIAFQQTSLNFYDTGKDEIPANQVYGDLMQSEEENDLAQ